MGLRDKGLTVRPPEAAHFAVIRLFPLSWSSMGTESSSLAFPAETAGHSSSHRVKRIRNKYLLKVRGIQGGGVHCISIHIQL